MPEKNPRVSIGLPVYNGENYLAEAIDSILAQTFEDFELIISDNASTDRTQEICEAYAAKDGRIRYYRSEVNKGSAWNFNRVFELARGEYFKWAAHDDYIAPEYLARAVEVLDQDPSVVLSYPRVTIVDEKRNHILDYTLKLPTDSPSPAVRFRSLLLDWSMCFEIFGLIRTSALKQTPVMGNYGHADGVLLARLGLLGRFEEIPEVLFFSRRHAKQSNRMFGLSESGGNNYHLYTVWFDPTKAGKIIFPYWRMFKEFLTSLWMYPLDLKTRLLGHFYMLIWIRKNARHLISDLIVAAKDLSYRLRGGLQTSTEKPFERGQV
jgi:glycosyltransferase involved in cell wall biosynthesis